MTKQIQDFMCLETSTRASAVVNINGEEDTLSLQGFRAEVSCTFEVNQSLVIRTFICEAIHSHERSAMTQANKLADQLQTGGFPFNLQLDFWTSSRWRYIGVGSDGALLPLY